MHLKLVGAGTLEQPACLLTGVESWCCQLCVRARTQALWFAHSVSEKRKESDKGLMLTTFACLQGEAAGVENQVQEYGFPVNIGLWYSHSST